MSLRSRLILVFVAATVAPLAATWWIATSLIEHSLSYSSIDQLDRLSRTLEQTGRELYQRSRDALKGDAAAGRIKPVRFDVADAQSWPEHVTQFWEADESERFVLSNAAGDRLSYLVRRPAEILEYSAPIGPVPMGRIADEFRQAREAVQRASELDLRKGFTSTFMLLGAAVWLVSFALLILMALRISRPIAQLAGGLDRVASGESAVRLEAQRADEVGRAIQSFNRMAAQLEESRDRLVYLTQLASWQMLVRKMAHELKNSLTPIRLTMEEIVARNAGAGDPLIEQAARIVVDEVESLERRIRAFSDFAAEPAVRPAAVAINAALRERIAFLSTGHPGVSYGVVLSEEEPVACADEDLLKGILTNLLENAAEAAGPGGSVLACTSVSGGRVSIEVRDSGPGLNDEARRSLFEPTISFKKRGMGLGLSIARKNALLMGGDIALLERPLPPPCADAWRFRGAAFRISLPQASAASYQLSEKRPADASVSPQIAKHTPARNLIADS